MNDTFLFYNSQMEDTMKKTRLVLLFIMLSMLLVGTVQLAMAFLQTDTPAPTIVSFSMPWMLWIPFILGFIGHWYSSYMRDKIVANFFVYFFTGVFNSISAVVGGFVTFAGFYAGNPSAYPNNFFGWASVFLISFAWDSLINGTTNSYKVPTTG
jgi:hypothetical protein